MLQAQALEYLLEIPCNINFRLYSHLQKCEKKDALRIFLNDFDKYFGFPEVNSGVNWQSELDAIILESLNDTPERDILVAYHDGSPSGAQGFAFARDHKEVYAEGLFVKPGSRGINLPRMLRNVLVNHLIDRGSERFYVGCGGGYSSVLLPESDAQTFAEKDIKENQGAIFGLRRNSRGNLILSYGIMLKHYNFMYDTTVAAANL